MLFKMADIILPDQIESCRSINVSLVSSSVHKYVNYSKQMQIRLAEINDNVSSVIKESCTGIDNICNRVRQCLFEMNQRERTTYLMDEVTEYEIFDETSKSGEEFPQDIDEILHNASLVEIIQENTGQSVTGLQTPEDADSSPSAENIQTITPFFTVINRQNQETSQKMESCRKQVLTKTIYSLLDKEESSEKVHEEAESGINFEHFQETVSTLCENFDMMNKLVETINKEIEQFSQTALTDEEKCLEITPKKKVDNSSSTKLKPIKRLSKCNSRQKSIQVGDCVWESQTDIELTEWNNRDSESFIIPDVYRKRAFTDLYQRLVMQVEANDSLIFFQTLMKRQRKLENKPNKIGISQTNLNIHAMNYSVPQKSVTNTSNQRQSKKLDMDKKYAGSLWFSQKHLVKDKGGSKNASRKVSKKDSVNKKTSRVIENKSEFTSPQRLRGQNKKTKVSDSVRSLMHTRNAPGSGSFANVARTACSLECTCRMLVRNEMPPSPSAKCRLQWLRAKPPDIPNEKIKFLDILDDLTHRDLLPLQSEYPRRDNLQPRELDYKDVQDTYIYKLMYGKQGTKDTWKQLFEPSIKCSKNNCSSCRTSRANSRKSREEKEKTKESFMDKFSKQNYSRSDILKKLSQYIFDPEKEDDICSRSVIVMPVRVYYDNYKPNEPPTKLKNPNKHQPAGTPKRNSVPPSKDSTKGSKKCEWSAPGVSKPMKVVYDGLPNKPQPSPNTMAVKTPATPSSLASSARQNPEKKSVKNIRSRSFSPKSFTSFCQDAASVKKEPTDAKRQENLSVYTKLQAEFSKIRRDIYEKKFTHTDRKLWASKYGKSVGQQLITYVQHQEPETARSLPKYAMPKLKLHSALPEKKNIASFLKEVTPHRQILSQVRNLKTKNDEIQDNIKKAIDVIERQMVDILHKESNSVEAFEIMEKEITSVLSLMKCNGNKVLKTIPSKSGTSKDKVEFDPDINLNNLENDYKIISDQLFERLQKILDTGGSSVPSTPPESGFKRKHQPKKDKDEMRKKLKLASSKRKKLSALSSSTSASMDEKLYTKRSPRPINKKTDKWDIKSKSTDIAEPVNKENWEYNCGDQNVNIIAHIESENSVNENDVICTQEQAWDNSEGDYTNQDTDMYYDVETDNTFDVVSDGRADRLLTAEEIPQTSDEISNFVKDTDADPTILQMEIEEFIKEELNRAIEKAEVDEPIESMGIEEFIKDELDKAIKKAETLADSATTTDLTKHTINIEMEEFINDELDKAIIEAETMVETPDSLLSNITENDIHTDLKEFINEELDKAIKRAETLAAVPNTPEITDEQRHIVTAEIKEFINEELDKALVKAEESSASNTLEITNKPRHVIIAEIKEFINEELSKALTEAEDFTAVSDSTNAVLEYVINSEVREFIAEELDKAIRKAEQLTSTPNSGISADDHMSIINTELKELINVELNKAIQKAEALAKIPDSLTDVDDPKPGEYIDDKIGDLLMDSIVTTDDDTWVEKLVIKETKLIIEEKVNTQSLEKGDSDAIHHSPPLTEKAKEDDECSSPNISEEIHKIIRRVEDIYSQLDDIQNSDSGERIPVFKEAEISDVHSEIFLTPFMHAVKETRKKPTETTKETHLEKSPSYYNVMNFLDNLNNMQTEISSEIHVARLHHYTYVYQQTTVYFQSEIWHELKHVPSCNEKSSCLKTTSEDKKETKHRKVSFSQTSKEDKSSQATLCPFHKVKAIKISSQQFPPLQQSNEEVKQNEKAIRSNDIKETQTVLEHTNKSQVSEKQCLKKSRCRIHKDRDHTDNEPNKKLCEVHGNVEETSEMACKGRKHCRRHHRCAKHGDCHEKTKHHQLSVIDDKSTQVFCQMQKENLAEPSAADERVGVTSPNNDDSTDCRNYIEDNPDDSKSTDKDFLDNSQMDPFYDYVNENLNPQNAKETQEVDNSRVQTRTLVVKEAPEERDLLRPQNSVISSKEIELYKKKLERRREIRLMRKSSVEIARQRVPKVHVGNDNVVLLKSFYAIVYILMFTALSLDYRCL